MIPDLPSIALGGEIPLVRATQDAALTRGSLGGHAWRREPTGDAALALQLGAGPMANPGNAGAEGLRIAIGTGLEPMAPFARHIRSCRDDIPSIAALLMASFALRPLICCDLRDLAGLLDKASICLGGIAPLAPGQDLAPPLHALLARLRAMVFEMRVDAVLAMMPVGGGFRLAAIDAAIQSIIDEVGAECLLVGPNVAGIEPPWTEAGLVLVQRGDVCQATDTERAQTA